LTRSVFLYSIDLYPIRGRPTDHIPLALLDELGSCVLEKRARATAREKNGIRVGVGKRARVARR
jgi:hypothetical protein